MIGNYILGPLPMWRHLPGGQQARLDDTVRTSQATTTSRTKAVALIPPDAVVSATSNSVGAHLSARPKFLSFPVLQDSTWVLAYWTASTRASPTDS